jgi:hypothetical protein
MVVIRRVLLRKGDVPGRVVEKIKKHILCSITFLRKSCLSGDNMEKIW